MVKSKYFKHAFCVCPSKQNVCFYQLIFLYTYHEGNMYKLEPTTWVISSLYWAKWDKNITCKCKVYYTVLYRNPIIFFTQYTVIFYLSILCPLYVLDYVCVTYAVSQWSNLHMINKQNKEKVKNVNSYFSCLTSLMLILFLIQLHTCFLYQNI